MAQRQYPSDGETVWIEYPEGRRFRARYEVGGNRFVADDGSHVAADRVNNWSRNEHEDYDISDDPKQVVGGSLTRDQ
ncbi:MAG TPA: hypothetical protein VH082_09375 [Rudaea sp.]|jgi:hypothetical protein|nr:hypothetical protein [Rudaea sp.]